MAFVIPALIGLVWLIPWFATFPDKQTLGAVAIKPAGTAAAASRPALTLGELIANHKVLGLFLIRVFTGPITTFYWPGCRSISAPAAACRSLRSASLLPCRT